MDNVPGFMPQDNCLNNDIQLSLSLHCVRTTHLDGVDNMKFSMKKPNTIVKGIERIWDSKGNVPNLQQIVGDYDRVLPAFGVVYEAGDKMVPVL